MARRLALSYLVVLGVFLALFLPLDARAGTAPAAAVAALLSLAAGLAFTRTLTQPVRSLVTTVRSFDLSQRIPEGASGELGELARGINEMADRLQESLVTLRREKDRAERAESSRREFLADVSHNLGTPLAAVQGWVTLLVDGIVTDDAERLELLHKIRRELHYVSRTVLQLLDLSRWEGTGPVLRFEEFPLIEPLMEVAESLQDSAEEAGTELQFEGLDPALRVRGDRSRVRELFQIFLENAVEHAGRGALVVVRLEPREGRLHVRLSDDGVGIAPERLARMRQRNQPSGGRGSGLGLAIAYKLAEGHGGDLEIRSIPGEGTTVTFTLPLA